MTDDRDEELSELIHSESLYRNMVENLRGYAVFLIDRKGLISAWNAGAREMFEYQYGEVKGKPYDFLAKDTIESREQADKEFRNALSGTRVSVEGWWLKKTGGVFWAETVLFPVHKMDGAVVAVSVIMKDLTERRRYELELLNAVRSYNIEKKKNELFMQALKESSLIAYTDVAGNFTDVNEKFCTASGYDRSELVGFNTRILNASYHKKEHFKKLWETILSGRIWVGEICSRKKDGGLFWAYGPIIPIISEDGVIEKFFTIRQEITDKKNLENQLWISQKLMQDNLEWRRNILDNANLIIIATDSRGTILTYNKFAEKILGYSASELLGRETPVMLFRFEEIVLHAQMAGHLQNSNVEANFVTLVEVVNRIDHPDESEWSMIKKDRSIVPVKMSISTLKAQGNEISGYLFVAHDITEEKQNREMLRAAYNTILKLGGTI